MIVIEQENPRAVPYVEDSIDTSTNSLFSTRKRWHPFMGQARLWDRQGKVVQEFKGYHSFLNSVAFSPDGKTILTGSNDNTARLWYVSMPLAEFLKKGNVEKLTEEQKRKYGIED